MRTYSPEEMRKAAFNIDTNHPGWWQEAAMLRQAADVMDKLAEAGAPAGAATEAVAWLWRSPAMVEWDRPWNVTTITPAEFEKAVARACLRAAAKRTREEPFRGGDMTAVVYGPVISEIADEADLSIPQTRRRLQALQRDGRLLRDDRRGGSTAWWLVGLAAEHAPKPVVNIMVSGVTTQQQAARVADHALRQTMTAPTARQHWSDVLGVPRDCSTSEARAAFQSAIAALDQADPDYPNQKRRVHDAINACCRDHEIQIEE